MARIVYGIHGTGHGHAMRGLTIARKLTQHEFLFVTNDDALNIFGSEFPVVTLPNLGTVFKGYKVNLVGTLKKAVPILAQREKYIRQAQKVIEDFKADVCMTDLEFFVPQAAKRLQIPCLTLDHQHIITSCKHELPRNMLWDYYVQGLTPKYLFKPTEYNLIVSFYAPPVLTSYNTRVVPPILRDKVITARARARDDGYILVYQSNTTHQSLVQFLQKSTDRLCYVFGYRQDEGREGNVIFMRKSEETFLELLEGACYVIQGGGHTLMTESLYLGKPVLTIPILAMLEQRINALYIEKLGYGMQENMLDLKKNILQNFEEKLTYYKRNIMKNNFCGNELIFNLVDTFIKNKHLDLHI